MTRRTKPTLTDRPCLVSRWSKPENHEAMSLQMRQLWRERREEMVEALRVAWIARKRRNRRR